MNKFLRINNFRNYDGVEIPMDIGDTFVLYGKNGEGKTNILEAVSIFSQGRGLRSCKFEDMIRSGSELFWNVTFSTDDGSFSSGYVKKDNIGRRIYKVCDKNVKNLNEFLKKHYVLWMTYETDRLFMMSPSDRRNFIDMFCFGKFSDHQKNISSYEKLTRDRIKILRQLFDEKCRNREDILKWLDIIESQISDIGLKICEARIQVTLEIEKGQYNASEFPKFRNYMVGNLEDLIKNSNNPKDDYRKELSLRREKDYFRNSTTLGPNRSDWSVFHEANQISANFCSAGEQKMLLLGVFISFIRQNLENDKRTLILLLDDVIAHLDFDHRVLLFKHVMMLKESFKVEGIDVVTFLSGTDKELFSELKSEDTVFLNVKNNNVVKD